MVATLNPTRKRRMVATALGTGASALIFTPMAHADTGTPLLDPAEQALGDLSAAADNPTPAPAPTPLKSLNDFASQALGVVPSNLLRTDSAGTTGADEVAAQTVPGVTNDGVTKAINNYNAKVEAAQANPVQHIAQNFLDAHNGHNDPNTIGQAFGAAQLPTAETINQINNDVNTLVGKVTSGEIVNDVQTAIDETLNSPQYEAWRTNTDSILNVDGNLHGVDRASAGISHLIDTVSTNPARALSDVVTAAGGPVNMVLNPIGATVQVATAILGPDVMRDFGNALRETPANFGKSLLEAAPALLAIPAGDIIGHLLGAPLGALPGAGVGALLGALGPHNLIPGLLAAIPGTILGGLATGSIGLIGSIMATLPLLGILPLAGAATGSALALAGLAATIFGIYLATYIPAAIISALLGAGLGVAVAGILAAIAAFNPAFLPLAAAGGFLTFLLMTAVIFGSYAALSALIPLTIFGVLAPLFINTGGMMGLMTGLASAALIASLAIPLITALSAIPGALAGNIFGLLAGTAASSWISAIIGANIGGLIGAVIGGHIGGNIGKLVGAAIGIPLFGMIAALTFGDAVADSFGKPVNDVRRAMDQGWRHSHLGQLIGTLEYNFYHHTETGNALGDLMNRINNLYHTMAFLDGRRLRDMLLRGGLLGSILGAIPGALTGGTIGTLLGLFNPLNLLNGLAAGIIAAIPGALAGGAAGSLLSDLLAPLVGIPAGILSFLPWLGVLFTLWAIPALLTTTMALASTIIPAIAAALVATLVAGILGSSPLWLPFAAVSTIMTLIQAVSFNPAGAALLPFTTSPIFGGIVAFSVFMVAAILTISIALAAVFIGIPTFFVVAALFTFPALTVPLAWTLALPLLLPLALGLSTLTGLAAGSAADILSKLVTIPLGALIGSLLKAIPSAIAGTIIASLTRALTYGAAGTGIGAGIGAVLGFTPGVIAALVTHLRAAAGSEPDGTQWVDGRIVNRGGFGDSLAIVPGLSGNKIARGATVAIPEVASPSMGVGTATKSRKRSLVDASALVGA